MLSKKQEFNIVRWIEALISPEFKQLKPTQFRDYNPGVAVSGQLYHKGCHCALAVAAEVMGVPRIGSFYFFPEAIGEGESPFTMYSPPETWFQKHFGKDIISTNVSHMSDTGTTFKQIALYLVGALPKDHDHDYLAEKVLDAATQERLRTPHKEVDRGKPVGREVW